MVRPVFKIVVGLALLGVLAWGLWLLFPSDERQIRRQLSRVAELATVTGEEGNIKRLSDASALAGQFATNATIVIDIRGLGTRTIHGRGEVHETALAVMAHGIGVTVEFHDVAVEVGASRLTATADLTATVRPRDQRDFGIQELRFNLRKHDSGWLIERVETVPTFR